MFISFFIKESKLMAVPYFSGIYSLMAVLFMLF